VTLWCYANNNGVAGREPLATVEVDPDGTFEADDVSLPIGLSPMCTLRALPTVDDPSTAVDERNPLNLSAYRGVAIGIGEVDPLRLTERFGLALTDPLFDVLGLKGTQLAGFDVLTQQRAGSWSYSSLSESGVYASSLYSGSNFDELDETVFRGVGVLDRTTSDGSAALAVDGRIGYTAEPEATHAGALIPGFSPLSVTQRALDAANGDFAFGEAHGVQHCLDDHEDVELEPDYDGCDHFGATGVRIERTYATSKDGRRLTVTDRLSSTDGRQHVVDLAYQNAFGDDPRYAFGTAPFQPQGVHSELTFDRAPASVLVDQDEELADGDDASATGAITYAQTPDRVVFDSATGYLAEYRRTVPSSGVVTIQQVLSQARTIEEVKALAAAAEADVSPKPVAPSVQQPREEVVSPPPAPAPGPKSVPAPPVVQQGVTTCTVPRLGRRRAKPAWAALMRAGCNLGRVRFVATRRLAPMRVVKQGRKAGRVLPGGTAVDLVISRKPKAKPARRARTSRR
jgi:hypothetical protein